MNRYLNPKSWIRENQEAIMSHFLNINISSKLVRSPFREDKNPTCGFYYNRMGCLYLHDFATDEHFDCISIVQKLYNLSYSKAILLIQIEADNFQNSTVQIHQTKNLEYIPGPNNFAYFNKLGITDKTLKKYQVSNARAVYIDEDLHWRATDKNPIFVYTLPSGRFKLYRPLSADKTKKWKSNTKSEDVLGYAQLPKEGKLLIITSSLKDIMLLREMGYFAIAFNSEGIATKGEPASQVEQLITHLQTRFSNVVLFLDNDEAGIKYAKKVSKRYNILSITIPTNLPKDISDVSAKYGFKKASKLMKKLLSRLFKVDTKFDDFVNDTSIKQNIFDERNNDQTNK